MEKNKKSSNMELGSEFEIDLANLNRAEDNIFDYLKDFYTIYTSNGRAALHLIGSALKKGVVLLPEFICDSVIESLKGYCEIRYYEVNEDLTVSINSLESVLDSEISAIYLLHYFGQLQPDRVLEYLQEMKNLYGFSIIEDTTHSIFTKPCTIGDYCICSIRKWFPIPDGGILYAKRPMDKIEIGYLEKQWSIPKLEAMVLKKYYLKYQFDTNQMYRKIFEKEEENLDRSSDARGISDFSRSLLECYSVNEIIRKRRENYHILFKETFPYEHKVLSGSEFFTPFVFPVYIKDRNDFRCFMTGRKIYCAVHWPYIASFRGKKAEQIAGHILSLPIDQRYGRAHMEYMIKNIEEYKGGLRDGNYNRS